MSANDYSLNPTLEIYYGNAAGAFDPAVIVNDGIGGPIAIGDINGDGRDDLLLSVDDNLGDTGIHVYLQLVAGDRLRRRTGVGERCLQPDRESVGDPCAETAETMTRQRIWNLVSPATPRIHRQRRPNDPAHTLDPPGSNR